jgi:hypothetical protein
LIIKAGTWAGCTTTLLFDLEMTLGGQDLENSIAGPYQPLFRLRK